MRLQLHWSLQHLHLSIVRRIQSMCLLTGKPTAVNMVPSIWQASALSHHWQPCLSDTKQFHCELNRLRFVCMASPFTCQSSISGCPLTWFINRFRFLSQLAPIFFRITTASFKEWLDFASSGVSQTVLLSISGKLGVMTVLCARDAAVVIVRFVIQFA